MKRSWYTPGPFERLTVRQIIARNYGRQTEMTARLCWAAEDAIRAGLKGEAIDEYAKEAIRHLDRYAVQAPAGVQ